MAAFHSLYRIVLACMELDSKSGDKFNALDVEDV